MGKKSDDEFSIDLKSIKGWFSKFSTNKNSKALIIILLILIPMFFAIFFRAYPYSLPATQDWAYNSVYNNIRSQVASKVNSQYPNLPTDRKNTLINQQMQSVLASQQQSIAQNTDLLSQRLKENFQDDTGQTYLLAIDPYFYYRYARNIIELGHYGDISDVNGEFDTHVLAPNGKYVPKHIHPYIVVYFHKFMNIFTNNSLMKDMFFLPILFSALAIIPAFFIAYRRAGLFGGFLAGMFLALHVAFLGRTAGGFADTDAYNVLFPLFISWLFIEAFELSKNHKKQGLLIGLAGLVVGIYSFAWSGWWYIFDFLILVLLIYAGYVLLRNLLENKNVKNLWSSKLKNTLIVFFMFLFMSGIFVTLISGFTAFTNAVQGPLAFKVIKQAAKPDLWPNVYTTVAELNPASIASIISQNGGKFLFFLSCLGLLLTLVKTEKVEKKDGIIIGGGILVYLLLISDKLINSSPMVYLGLFILPVAVGLIMLLKDKRDIDIKYALFLAIWFVGTIYASIKGTRFVLLMVPAFAVAIGIGLGLLYKILLNFTSKELKIGKSTTSVILVVLISLLLISPIIAANSTAKGQIPSMNDAWYNTLTGIKNNSSNDAIITSWWDFGHWFKAIADRKVTFDGGSQNRPQAHWVGKLLMEDNENLSVGILRMLDCGGNKAFEEINKQFDDTEKSVNLLYQIIALDKESARNILLDKGLNADAIINLTHCDPPQSLLITSEDMIGKSGVWAHFGSWDFQKSFIYNNVKDKQLQPAINLLVNRYGIDENQAADDYFAVQALTSDKQANDWISPWPGYATSSWSSCDLSQGNPVCNMRLGLGKSSEGYNVVLAGALINQTKPENSYFIIQFLDPNTHANVGSQISVPNNVIIAGDKLVKYDTGVKHFDLDLLYDSVNNKALVLNPLLSTSMFTKLYFLNGRYTKHFEIFSDKTSITGQRIAVWNVLW